MPTKTVPPSDRFSLINGIEKKLSSTFKPLKPDRDFVNRLKTRLATTPSLKVEQDHSSGLLLGIVSVLAVILGLLLGKRIWKFLFPQDPSD
jgi:hypothetical protein